MAAKSNKTTAKKPARSIKPQRVARVQRVQPASRPEKPVFRAGTWIALAAFILVIGAAIYMNRQAEEKANATETPGTEETFVFDESLAVAAIEISNAEGSSARIERNADNAWVLSKPEKAEADQGAAEAASTQVGALRVIISIDNADDLSIFGLDTPDYLVNIEFEDGTKSTLEVGDKTPTENGYYVRKDKKEVFVVSLSGIDTLANLISAPPYLNTPTPSPTATSTPLPTSTPDPAAESSTTPEATPTSNP